MNSKIYAVSNRASRHATMGAVLLAAFSFHANDPIIAAQASRNNLRVEMNRGSQSTAHGPDLQKQQELLAKIKSPSTPQPEKAIACKQLTIHGSDEAVPVLKPLLNDPKLASWARIALEAIPGSASSAALRDAAGQLDGILLIGVINSIGERRDAKALRILSSKLKDRDPEVAAAAAVALGKIGGTSSADLLTAALKRARPEISAAVAEGSIRCAERFLDERSARRAQALYDAVLRASVPANKKLEATRGAILARGDAGIPLLLQELRSGDQDRISVGLSTARELPGRKATEAIAAEVSRTADAIQPHLLLALADRHDPAALPNIMEAARAGSKPLRLVAVTVIERLGNLSSVPALVQVAMDQDSQISQAAVGALTRLSAEGVDKAVVSSLQNSTGRQREVLIRVAGQRQIMDALPAILASAEAKDPTVRTAALKALGSIGTESELPSLIKMLDNSAQADREDLESALVAISSRHPGAVRSVTPLARSSDADLRSLALRCLSASGGAQALAVVAKATTDTDADLQDQAVRTLSTWPNTWPEDSGVADPLLSIVRSTPKRLHKVLALRGYIQYIEGDTKLNAETKVEKLREVLPLIERPEEKSLATAVLGGLISPKAVDLLIEMASSEDVREDACSALLKVGARNVAGLPKEYRQKALQTAAQLSKIETTRKRAEERVKSLE
jgi:HEAT repeat protein